jgi:hypothetical protein
MSRTIFLVHHTHTDIGYTEVQGRIRDRQVDFIRQAVHFADSDPRFRWTCETFWAVEQYLLAVPAAESQRFFDAVRRGQIGLSANYLNYSELLDYDTHLDLTARIRRFADEHGLPVSAAMTADINGHSLAFARALADRGVRHLFTCVHTYHGMYPLRGNQMPFHWELPGGKRLLVWNGEHYHLGNELGLVPGAFMTHMVTDRVPPGDDLLDIAGRRVPAYWQHLEKQGYPYDFVPLMVSGLMTDNAPPASRLTDHLERWNERHGDDFRVELVNLETFFEHLETRIEHIPTHSGLWPDWWADLLGAAPAAVQVFREAQRMMHRYRRMVDCFEQTRDAGSLPERTRAEDLLALYAEHTFGHSGTYTHSDHLLVAVCSMRKSGYAAEAYEVTQQLSDRVTGMLGGSPFESDRPLRFRVANPGPGRFAGRVGFELDQFEAGDVEVRFEPEGTVPPFVHGFSTVDADTGAAIPSQAFRAPRGVQINTWMELEEGAVRTIDVVRDADTDRRDYIRVNPAMGIDQAKDVTGDVSRRATSSGIETPFVTIEWKPDQGITRWEDRRTGRSLLANDRKHAPFTPVYEVSPGAARTPMGRNRKAPNVVRSAGRLAGAPSTEDGQLFSTALLTFELPGTRRFAVLLRAYHIHPLVEVEVVLHKETCQDVENLYLALPFSAGEESDIWIDTSLEPARPWKDQLPGTLIDFFHVFDGFASVGDAGSVAVAMLDTPLLQLGDLEHGPRHLAGDDALRSAPMRPYAWVMNNFWETNANIDLAGFYRFRYAVTWRSNPTDAASAIADCRALCHAPAVFRTA